MSGPDEPLTVLAARAAEAALAHAGWSAEDLDLILLATSIGVDLVVMHGYAFLASRAQRWLATARARRAQNRVFGGVLMAMGASLFMVKRAAT